jgi:hypothetical protein
VREAVLQQLRSPSVSIYRCEIAAIYRCDSQPAGRTPAFPASATPCRVLLMCLILCIRLPADSNRVLLKCRSEAGVRSTGRISGRYRRVRSRGREVSCGPLPVRSRNIGARCQRPWWVRAFIS